MCSDVPEYGFAAAFQRLEDVQMYGHKAKPSRTWTYKAQPPQEALEHIEDQFRRRRQYTNKLIELERQRRDAALDAVLVDRTVREHYITWQLCQDVVVAYMEEIQQSKIERQVKTALPEQKAQLELLRVPARAAYRAFKAARVVAWEVPTISAALEVIESHYRLLDKAARAESGLYWGNYLAIEQALSQRRRGAPPEFRRYSEEGTLTIQIQKGLACERIFGESVHIRFERTDNPLKVLVWFRVGSVKGKPLWTKFCIRLYRPLPEHGKIMWVRLHRRVPADAQRARWWLQLIIGSNDWEPHEVAKGKVKLGIDVGWRRVPEGLRVALGRTRKKWVPIPTPDVTDRHETSVELVLRRWRATGELVIPEAELTRWTLPRDLASTRDRNRPAILLALHTWMQATGNLPEWFQKRTRGLPTWRSQPRLHRLYLAWEQHRIAGDTEIFALFTAWRTTDLHLWRYQAGVFRRAVAWRDYLYRNWIVELRKHYPQLIVEDADWSELCRRPAVDETDPQVLQDYQISRRYRAIAAVGRMRTLCREMHPKVTDVASRLTTQTCHACGREERFDAARELEHTCTQCGELWDQDENASHNIRERARPETAV